MADEKSGLTFLPSVGRRIPKEGNNDRAMGCDNLNTPLVLPSLNLASVDVQLVNSMFTHRQVCKKVCEWFCAWRSWQKRILLCSVSDKCTKGQLQALVTTLEPVFHRDFIARLKGTYPTTSMLPRVIRTVPSVKQLIVALQSDKDVDRTADSSKNDDYLKASILDHDFSRSAEHNQLIVRDKNNVDRTTLVVSEQTVQAAVEMAETRRHEHAPPFLRRVSTPHFFPKFQHQQLGLMKTALRTEDYTDRIYEYAPIEFKYEKWWERHKGTKLLKPRRSKLSNHFKSQIDHIHQWLDEWQPHERVGLLSDVVKCCDAESLTFFAQCLAQRLRDCTDLNCVPDQVMFNIFSYLNVESLCRSSQVCRRWRFLTNDSRFWKSKIAALGASEGVFDLSKKIEVLGQGQAVDWKQAYKEVRSYYRELFKVRLKDQQQAEIEKKMSEEKLQERRPSHVETPLHIEPPKEEDIKTVASAVVDIPFQHVVEDLGPAQSPSTTDQKDNRDEFTADEFDGKDLTGGNLKMLTRSLKALAQDDNKPQDLEVALDVRPALIQASNLLREDGRSTRHKFRYLSLAVQGVFAVLRVRRVQGHMDAVLCLQFDKRRIITGSADRTVRVWDVRSGRSIHKLKGHKGGVRCLQFDHEKIVTGSWDMTVMIWNVVTFKRLKVLYGHSGCVSSLRFSKRYLASGSHDRTIRIWNAFTWDCEGVIDGHQGAVMSLEFTEQCLVSASLDRTLKVWDLRSQNCIRTLIGHRDGVLTTMVLGSLVLSGSADGMIMFWDIETGACEVGIQAHEGPVYSLDYNGQQHVFSSGGDHLVKEWDLSTSTCLRSLQGHKGPVYCVKSYPVCNFGKFIKFGFGTVSSEKASPHRVVSCSADGFTRIWDLDYQDRQSQTKKVSVQENFIQPRTIQQNPRKYS